MKKSTALPRHYHFFCGNCEARVPERMLLSGRFAGINPRCMSVAQALQLMRVRAGQYKRAVSIEVTRGGFPTPSDPLGQLFSGWIEVVLTSRGEYTYGKGGPFRLIFPARPGQGLTCYHDNVEQLFATFEPLLMRYTIGEADAL